MRTVTTMISMKPGTSGKKGGNTQKGYVTLVKDFQSPPYHEGRTSFQRFKRYSVMTGRIPAKS